MSNIGGGKLSSSLSIGKSVPGSMAAAHHGGRPRLILCETDPHTRPSMANPLQPNVLILSGLPWYCTETEVAAYLTHIYPDVAPITTRLYTFPHNGVSRGICFVEYPSEIPASAAQRPYNVAKYYRTPPYTLSTGMAMVYQSEAPMTVDLTLVQHHIAANPLEQRIHVTAQRYHLTDTNWDRSGQLPPLPTDPPMSKMMVGFGDEGRKVRCGPHIDVPNTISSTEALSKVERCRKRLRAAMERAEAANAQGGGNTIGNGIEREGGTDQ